MSPNSYDLFFSKLFGKPFEWAPYKARTLHLLDGSPAPDDPDVAAGLLGFPDPKIIPSFGHEGSSTVVYNEYPPEFAACLYKTRATDDHLMEQLLGLDPWEFMYRDLIRFHPVATVDILVRIAASHPYNRDGTLGHWRAMATRAPGANLLDLAYGALIQLMRSLIDQVQVPSPPACMQPRCKAFARFKMLDVMAGEVHLACSKHWTQMSKQMTESKVVQQLPTHTIRLWSMYQLRETQQLSFQEALHG